MEGALGNEVRQPQQLVAAEDVGRQTMRRINPNLDRVYEGLSDVGSEFEPGEASDRYRLLPRHAKGSGSPLRNNRNLADDATIELIERS